MGPGDDFGSTQAGALAPRITALYTTARVTFVRGTVLVQGLAVFV